MRLQSWHLVLDEAGIPTVTALFPVVIDHANDDLIPRPYFRSRVGVGGPAGPAKARPLFSGSFVSSSDCRDSLRTTRKLALCSRFSLSFPLLCRRIRSPARPDQTASAPTHFDSTSSFYCRTLPVVDPPCTSMSIFYLQWPDHFWNAGAASEKCLSTLAFFSCPYQTMPSIMHTAKTSWSFQPQSGCHACRQAEGRVVMGRLFA